MLGRKRKPDPPPGGRGDVSQRPEEIHAEGAPPYGSDSLPMPSLPTYRNGLPPGAVHFGWILGSLGSDVIERLPFGVYAADNRGTVCDANAAFLQLLGVRRVEDIAQRSIREFLASPGDVIGSQLPSGSVRLRGMDGVERSVEHTRLPSDFLQAGPYHFGVVREVTDATERGTLHAQRLASLGGLTGRVAHDLNNLLVAVLGHASLVLDGDPQATGRAQLEQIVEAAGRARELTHQLVEYSGKAAAEVREVDLNRLVEETVRLIEVSVPKKIELEYRLSEGIPPVWAYPIQIRQVVMNLVVNASEAIGDRMATVTVSTRMRECAPLPLPNAPEHDRCAMGRYCVLEVADTGPGMNEKTRRQIFEPFFTSKQDGRGLGLAAVADIVSSHRGAIELESALGRGTCFRVLLPTAVNGSGAQTVEAPRSAPTVLVVDDEDVVRNVARVSLERAGFSVLVASDGEEALDIFRSHASDLAAVILDFRLPVLEGVEVYREMKKIRSDVRVVLSSGYLQRDLGDDLREAGFAGFIQKPYTPKRLVEQLRSVLSG